MRKIYALLMGMLLTIACDARAGSGETLLSRLAFQQTLSGQVTDESNTPLPGVNVLVKGSTSGTVTDGDGKFTLAGVATDGVLVFSFIGYTTREVAVNGQSVVNVSLQPDIQSLDEVLVTALGVKKESKKLGYAATAVKTDDMVLNRTTNPMESLVGKVAGLNITPPAAGAGASMQVRLRGQASFNGNNAPLFVINGLPIDQGVRNANGLGEVEGRDRGDNLQNINPDDIESMTVLKGATAAALYGSRAANGAIIITTKSGSKSQGMGVEFTSSYTASQALNFMDEIVQTEYGQGRADQRFTTVGDVQQYGQFAWGEKYDGAPTINFDGVMRPYSPHPYQLFDFLQTGTNFTNTLALSGGGANGSFRASFSNADIKGIQPTNTYKKRILNVGINQDVTKKLKLQLNINYTDEQNFNPPQIGTQGPGAVNFFNRMPISVPMSAYRESAIDPSTDAEYKYSAFLGTVNNPFFQIQKKQFFKDDRTRLLGTTTLRYELTSWLYAQGRVNFDRGTNFMEWNTLNGAGTTTPVNDDGTYKGNYNIRQVATTDLNADFLVGVNKEFGKFSVDASVGGNTLRSKWQSSDDRVTNFTVPNLYSLANGTIRTPTFGYSESRVNSLYGWTEFGYNGMFYLNLTGRQDWFSVLNPKNNTQFYPSVSGSFIFSELLPNLTWLSYGKLRASAAEASSVNGVGPYDGLLTYSIGNNQFNGQTLANVSGNLAPNPNITLFKTYEKEIGLEARLFNNRVTVDVAYFNKETRDQIADVILSNASGYNTSKQNQTSLRNRGLEFMIEGTPVQTSNFKWTTSWNNTYLSTLAIDVGTVSGSLLVGIPFNQTGNEFLGALRHTEGMALNQLYVRTYRRDAEGRIVVNANGRLLPSTGGPVGDGFFPVGSAMPKYTGGWSNTVTYKNLSLGVFIDYKFGGTVLTSTLLNMTRQGLSKMSLIGRGEGLLIDGVYADGTPNTTVIPSADLQGHYTDYRSHQIGDPFVFKSDFIKLRTISLSYNFSSMIKNVERLSFIKGLMLSASCRNVAILYKDLPGLDPEAIQSSGDMRLGYENSSLPTTRNYNVTLNVKF